MAMIKRLVIMCICTLFYSLSAHAEISCPQVESIGKQFNAVLLEQINAKVAGKKKKINPRKTLHIKSVQWIKFDGCSIKARINVKLKRKVRRDAVGYLIASGTVRSFDGKEVCIKSAKIHKIRVSNTLKIGERFYRWAANRSLPKDECYKIN